MSAQKTHDKPLVGFGPVWFRLALGALGALLIVDMLLGSIQSRAQNIFPRPFRYFGQIACLFPRAKTSALEYRVLAYSCEKRDFAELDLRPFFPVNADHKENRLHRALYFFHDQPAVMRELEAYILRRYRAFLAGTQRRLGTSELRGPIGGIAVAKIREPLPKLGEKIPRYRRKRFLEFPTSQAAIGFRSRYRETIKRCREARK